MPMLRRHKKGDTEIHYEPALRCVSGNYVTAKRRGIIDGVDYMYTGEVRFVLKDAVKKQLDDRNIVLLSNLGFTAAGELLNCNTYDVGLHAAVELGADKLIFMHTDELRDLALPPWLPLSDAQSMLLRRLGTLPQGVPQADVAMLTTVEQEQAAAAEAAADACAADAKCAAEWSASGAARPPNYAPPPANANGKKASDVVLNLDTWAAVGFPTSFATCVIACCKGVKRAHLVDAHTDGGLLLELYSREGVGTMISTDFYEGAWCGAGQVEGPGQAAVLREGMCGAGSRVASTCRREEKTGHIDWVGSRSSSGLCRRSALEQQSPSGTALLAHHHRAACCCCCLAKASGPLARRTWTASRRCCGLWRTAACWCGAAARTSSHCCRTSPSSSARAARWHARCCCRWATPRMAPAPQRCAQQCV